MLVCLAKRWFSGKTMMKLNNHSINRVLMVGGTHGNELTGVYLVKLFQQFPELSSGRGKHGLRSRYLWFMLLILSC
jgi:succinylglutamate desuccinylase